MTLRKLHVFGLMALGAWLASSCAAGYGCFNNGTYDACYQWCTAGSSCAYGNCDTAVFDPPITLGGTTYGVCL